MESLKMSENSLIVDLCNAVNNEIKKVPGAECTVFDLVPYFSFSEMKQLRIVVAPQSLARTNQGAASREGNDKTVKINIAIMKKCVSKSEIPDLLFFTEKIADALNRKVISASLVISVEFDPVYDPDVFRRDKVFCSVCTLTLKVLK